MGDAADDASGTIMGLVRHPHMMTSARAGMPGTGAKDLNGVAGEGSSARSPPHEALMEPPSRLWQPLAPECSWRCLEEPLDPCLCGFAGGGEPS